MMSRYTPTGPVDCSLPIVLEKLEGKTLLVTGGSSGLGLAYVEAFDRAGATVINADLRPPIEKSSSSRVHYVKCDVTSWDEQKAAFQFASSKSATGLIDIIIANAGISGDDPLLKDLDADDVQEPDTKLIRINLIGIMYTIRLALNHFGKYGEVAPGDKCLILKSSIMGYLDSRLSYAASKFGIRAMMRGIRHMGRCRVNIVAPWFINTPIMAGGVGAILHKQLEAQGSDLAKLEDCVSCVLRISTDTNINGRGLAIVPRHISGHGFADLEEDEFTEGSICDRLQKITLGLSHRK